MERLTATYLIETTMPLADAAAAMAGEQSTGTFIKIAGEDDPTVQRQAATIEGVRRLAAGGRLSRWALGCEL